MLEDAFAFAYCFEKTRLTNRGGSDLEHNKHVGQISVIMRLINSEDGDLLSCFDRIIENKIDNTSLKQILKNSHEKNGNKSKIKGQLPVQHIFGL